MMRTKYWHTLFPAIALGLSFPVVSSFADEGYEEAESRFEQLDTDGDDLLSRQELVQHRQARRQARFDQLDKNADGLLHIDEMPMHLRMRMEHASQRLTELRGDGIDIEEFTRLGEAGMERRMSRMDKNDDDMLDRSELRAKPSGKRCWGKRSKREETGI